MISAGFFRAHLGASRLLAPWTASTVRCLSAAGKPDLAMIKELRERSGAPVKDVKAALEEGGWDMDLAFQALRKKGLAAAAKKGGRAAEEGLVGIASGPGASALVEINCETDFVARNEKFQSLLTAAAQAVLASEDVSLADSVTHELPAEVASTLKVESGPTISEAVAEVGGTVRENVQFCRAFKLQTDCGVISSYLHTSPAAGLGRIGAMVVLEAADGSPLEGDTADKVQELGKKLAMHVTAVKPLFLDRDSVSPEALEAEKKLLTEQAAASGKPANIIEKMVTGRLSKFYEEFCLVDQKFVMDDSMKVSALLKAAGKDIGKELKLVSFLRAQVGERSSGSVNP